MLCSTLGIQLHPITINLVLNETNAPDFFSSSVHKRVFCYPKSAYHRDYAFVSGLKIRFHHVYAHNCTNLQIQDPFTSLVQDRKVVCWIAWTIFATSNAVFVKLVVSIPTNFHCSYDAILSPDFAPCFDLSGFNQTSSFLVQSLV